MKSRIMLYHRIIFLVVITISSVQLYSQPNKGIGFDVSLYDYDETGLHLSVFYNWNIKRNLIASTGLSFFQNEVTAGWFSENNTSYSFGHKNRRVNGYLAGTFVLPVIKNFGFQINGNILFEIIPFNYISIDKGLNPTERQTSELVGKYVFTQFNPGAFADIGIYYDINKNNVRLRLMATMGYGFYDPVRDYRRTTIDGQKLGQYIHEKKHASRLSFKIIGYW